MFSSIKVFDVEFLCHCFGIHRVIKCVIVMHTWTYGLLTITLICRTKGYRVLCNQVIALVPPSALNALHFSLKTLIWCTFFCLQQIERPCKVAVWGQWMIGEHLHFLPDVPHRAWFQFWNKNTILQLITF